ncbi:hypothetical protein FDP41_010969 [Naegleria fowleri]|uniref:RGS domain-containing protein n=1 Tax=Naegleria fowleri TaxID=5763 RepID=A0A6A5C795_NAEFO|nr:uncharacterized protein FDP41_010969 [Naegleria fowleri]KAF0982991.1 hypothetical protein FDP41_010969 [Naegleria fowleri]CAG4715029.1 unnamed protein product [Naegleria fowleri]
MKLSRKSEPTQESFSCNLECNTSPKSPPGTPGGLVSSPTSPYSASTILGPHSGKSCNLLNVAATQSSRSMPTTPLGLFHPMNGELSPLSLGEKIHSSNTTPIDEKLLKQIVVDNMKRFTIVFDTFIEKGGDNLRSFREFLKMERNDAPLDFIEIVDSFKQVSDPNKKYEMAKTMIDTYIDDSLTSDKQLNLPNTVQEDTLKKFEHECSISLTPNNLFDSALTEVYISLKTDSFLRYTNSPLFILHICSHVQKEIPNIIGSTNAEALKKCLVLYFSDIGFRNSRRSRVHSLSMTSSFSLPSTAYSKSGNTLIPITDEAIVDTTSQYSDDKDEPVFIKERFTEFLKEQEHKFINERFFDLFYDLTTQDDMWDLTVEHDSLKCFTSKEKFYSPLLSQDQPDESNEKLSDTNSVSNFGLSELSSESKSTSILNGKNFSKLLSYRVSQKQIKKSAGFSKKKGLPILKNIGIVSATSKEVLEALLDTRFNNILDPTLRETKFMEYIQSKDSSALRFSEELSPQKSGDYSVCYHHCTMKMPWPLSKREFLVGTSVRRELNDDGTESDNYVMVRKSISPKEVPVEKGFVRGLLVAGILIEQISANSTRYTSIHFADYGGKIPKSFCKKIQTSQSTSFHSGLTKVIENRRNLKEKGLTAEQSLHTIDTLEDYLQKVRLIVPPHQKR